MPKFDFETVDRRQARATIFQTLPPAPDPSLSVAPPLASVILPSPRPVLTGPSLAITTPRQITTNLSCPWAIGFLPDGNLLVTQRDLSLLTWVDATTGAQLNLTVDGTVSTGGDGGLLGLAIDPQFSINSYVYVVQTFSYKGSLTQYGNRVVRYVVDLPNQMLRNATILLQYDGGQNHNGGCIKVGLDGMLYVGAGDALNEESSQNARSLSGKILRLTRTGEVPGNNPFADNYVWSFGHRNPVGLCWQASRLWSSETGPSANDEINLIQKGANYGSPFAIGEESFVIDPYGHATIAPAACSGDRLSWMPGGMTYFNNALYFAALGIGNNAGTGGIYKTMITGSSLSQPMINFSGTYGRIRECVLGPGNMLYFSTSNRDNLGDGTPDSIFCVSFW